ncbi:hypothetical protein M404DRAFT_127847 [Pisolithus tinctorius Marx 270]|uniref:WH1 domain-containing protein n=1 Tax=Pisolithus tinctorius Marx 270 TaxID=870435 RepID=A0A0C3JPG0_PISTI|nr:hypothetical protein M404DRAFT_127847 [Pisolithus tinctorius Marx 270]
MHQPTTAFFTPEDKQRHPYLSSVLELNTQKVIATAAVRVYYAPFINPHLNWTYSKLKGILVFGRDREGLGSLAGVPSQLLSPPPDRGGAQGHGLRLKEKYWFRLIDVKTDRVVWMFSVPEVFEYCKDKPFFHYFTGTTRMFGFCFDEDEEADVFFKKVADRTRRHSTNLNPLKSKNKSKSLPASANQPLIRPSTTTPLKPSMISGPSPHSFVHVSHVGISANGGIESSKNVEPAWSALIADLQGYGFESEGELVSEAGHGGNSANADFMEGFLAGAKAVKDRVVGTSTAAEAGESFSSSFGGRGMVWFANEVYQRTHQHFGQKRRSRLRHRLQRRPLRPRSLERSHRRHHYPHQHEHSHLSCPRVPHPFQHLNLRPQ